jgi:tRNA U34 2-thiouridine synthase MnmA/TrmU
LKALALLSGGLDSTLAVRIILDQGIDVEALKFTSPFCQCDREGRCYSAEVAKELNIPIKTIAKGTDYIDIIKNPKHGYGSGINPCIDCRIYMLKKAKEYAGQTGAQFIFTGEVLGQRPMSQHRRALMTIERESGLEGMLLRPLCAQYLPETKAEKKGWVDRSKLFNITGRGRKAQYELARKYDISSFSCPAGGCLLTDKNFARRMRDCIKYKKDITIRDITMLKTGRHFRYNDSKIVVGRNENENEILRRYKNEYELMFLVPDIGSPITILQESVDINSLHMAASITAAYSDALPGPVSVLYGTEENNFQLLEVVKQEKKSIMQYNI